MGNIQVKTCEPGKIENSFNCSEKNIVRNGFCKGTDLSKYQSKSPEEWNNNETEICAKGFKAHLCDEDGCECEKLENCGKLNVTQIFIIVMIIIFVILFGKTKVTLFNKIEFREL